MFVKSAEEFQAEVFRHLSFTPCLMKNYIIYKNDHKPEDGYCIQYKHSNYYTLGIADYTVPKDFDISFDNPNAMLRFGTVFQGVTKFRIEGKTASSFSPSSFLVYEKDLRGKQVWKKDQHFHGVELTIHSAYFEEFIEKHFKGSIDLSMLMLNYTYHSIPLEIIAIIQKLQRLALNDELTPIYLESKVLECIAILGNELHSTSNTTFTNQLYYGSITIGKNRTINLTSTDIQAIKNAYNILTENPYSPPTIEHLSKLVLLNEQKLKAGFNLHYHMSIGEYTNTLRMATAANLLLTTDFSVEEIGTQVGYHYSSNFTKMFRKTYGKTPLQYRKTNRDNLF